jgi:pimeloyl-ACP methyl ester carboxylesterase
MIEGVFNSDGVEISYYEDRPVGDVGAASDPILLIHGFASNTAVNWVNTLWVKTLVDAGRRVIAYDNRGHGRSAKLYDPAQYGGAIMAEDARRLLDHLGVGCADVLGYSMGARIAAFLAMAHPQRVRSLIFGGMGVNMVHGVGAPGPLAKALETDNPADVVNDAARSFRIFAEETGSDRKALAACIRSSRDKISPERLAAIRVPTLIAVGAEDVIAGSAQALGQMMPGAEVLDIPNRDHMKAVGDKTFKCGVIEFLNRRP